MNFFTPIKNFFARPVRDWRNTRELARRRTRQRELVQEGHEAYKAKMLTVTDEVMAYAMTERSADGFPDIPSPKFVMEPYVPQNDAVAPKAAVLAMDNIARAAFGPEAQAGTGMLANGGFPGYAYLTELTQITEYRDMSETTAKEMCRKWIELRSDGDEDRTKILKDLKMAMQRLHVKEWFQWAATTDGFQGRAQLFLDFDDTDDAELASKLLIQKEKIAKGSLKRLKGVEPITTYPAEYNADDPLAQDYYEPSAWWVYSRRVHATRFLTFVGRPVPDLLKPVYNFGGMSLSQLAMPYVDYWLSTRDSVGRLLRNFSTKIFKTDMSGIMQGLNYEKFGRRMKFFSAMQQNQGVFLCDKEKEDVSLQNVPLSGLDKLQAQSQEHMASVAKTPLTILFGLSPVGLTATAETDITIYNNHVNKSQESLFRRPLENLIKIIMLSEFGEIYEDITFDFVSLVSENEKEKALMRKSDGDRDVALITAGVVTPEEVRAKVAADPDSGFDNLNVDKPQGKLQKPAPAKGKGAKAKPDNSDLTAAANTPDGMPALLRTAADAMLTEAHRQAMDAGIWHGNRHTGTIGSENEDPTVTAMKTSAVAQKATNVANTVGTRAAHERAAKAHDRAIDAHKAALAPADREAKPIHESYIDAHEASAAAHRLAAAPSAEEVEA